MIYKLLNKIFGWDYIHWTNSADQGIARVHVDREGTPYYWRYKCTRVADRFDGWARIIWLTCPSSKYLKEKDGQ